MRLARSFIIMIMALTVAVSSARAEVLIQNGTLASDPIPEGYRFELAVMLPRPNNILQVEVDAKSCTNVAPGPDERECVRAITFFGLPAAFQIRGNLIWFQDATHNLMIGDIIGIGQARWVRMRRGATIKATNTVVQVLLDTALLSRGEAPR